MGIDSVIDERQQRQTGPTFWALTPECECDNFVSRKQTQYCKELPLTQTAEGELIERNKKTTTL